MVNVLLSVVQHPHHTGSMLYASTRFNRSRGSFDPGNTRIALYLVTPKLVRVVLDDTCNRTSYPSRSILRAAALPMIPCLWIIESTEANYRTKYSLT